MGVTVLAIVIVYVLLGSLIFRGCCVSRGASTLFSGLSRVRDLLGSGRASGRRFQLQIRRLYIGSGVRMILFSNTNELTCASIPRGTFHFRRSPKVRVCHSNGSMFVENGVPFQSRDSEGVISRKRGCILSSTAVETLGARIVRLCTLAGKSCFICVRASLTPVHRDITLSGEFLVATKLLM